MAPLCRAAVPALMIMCLLVTANVMVLANPAAQLCDLKCVDVEEADEACGSTLCAEEMDPSALCSEECMEALEALMTAGGSCRSRGDRETVSDIMDELQEIISERCVPLMAPGSLVAEDLDAETMRFLMSAM